MKSILVIIAAVVLLVSCKDDKNQAVYSEQAIVEIVPKNDANHHPGKKLMENQCYVCHNPSTGQGGRIAPPMVAVKSHYMTDEISKEDFVDAVWDFVKKPNQLKSKIPGAVRRFNLMPYQEFKEEEIRQIAAYMYEYKIEEPKWFKKHIEEESKGKMQYHNDGKEKKDVKNNGGVDTEPSRSTKSKTNAERGLEYALNTKKELGKNLMETIQKGTKEAVTFCNKQAYPITDSMATAQNATIKRVSDQPRNSQNQADEKELGIITQFKKAIANNQPYEPVTEVENGRTHFYYPITTNSMCLQCHGTTTNDINKDVLSTISKLYPTDKATGYGMNEVRGLWSITYE